MTARPYAALAAVLSLIAACSDSTSPDEDPVTLTAVSWGGSYQQAMADAWFDPYAAANPHVTLLQDGPTDYGQIADMVEAGEIEWDVVDVENDFGLGETEGLLEPIDCTIVPCDQLQPDRFQTTGYRVPVMQWGIVLTHREDVTTAPTGMDDFFDPVGFPGQRAVRRTATGSGIFEAALLADGVAPESLYPLDLDRAVAKLEDIGDGIVWYEDGDVCPSLVADGTVALGLCLNGRVFDAQQDGDPVVIQWTEALVQADYLVVPRGVADVDAAMELIAYMTSAENNSALSSFISYGPVNEQALDDVDPAVAPHLPSTYGDVTIARDDVWIEENREEMENRFDAFVAAHGG